MKITESHAEMEARHARERAALAAVKKQAEHAEDTRLVAWLRRARPSEHASLLAACDVAAETKRKAAADRKAKSRAVDVTPAGAGVTLAPYASQHQDSYTPTTQSSEAYGRSES